MFRHFDVDGSGEVSGKEFKQALTRMGFRADSEEFNSLVANVDKNKDGSISYEEFVDALQQKDYNSAVNQANKVSLRCRSWLSLHGAISCAYKNSFHAFIGSIPRSSCQARSLGYQYVCN